VAAAPRGREPDTDVPIHRRLDLLLLPVFFASGFAALVYQMVWQRLLTFFSGADVYSVTLIVSAFMAGLGLGSVAGASLADRLSPRRRIVAFAAAELAVAAFAVGSIPLLYGVLFQRLGAHQLPAGVVALALFVVLLWPTFFMGLTLPLLARTLTETVDLSARRIGGLYGWNTLGAAAGALVAVWVVIRQWGFGAAVHLGAGLNVACAAGALLLLALPRDPAAGPVAGGAGAAAAPRLPSPREDRLELPFWAWLGLYALSGFVALSLEIVWLRLLGTIHKPSSFTFATLLAVYLLGLGGGALWGGRIALRSRRPAAAFLLLQALVTLYAGASLAVFVAIVDRASFLGPLWEHLGEYEAIALGDAVPATARWISRGGDVAPFARDLAHRFLLVYVAAPLALVGPPTVFMGLSFAFLQRTVQTDLTRLGRRVGWLQTANIVGSTLGAALTGLVLLHWWGTTGTLRLLFLLAGVFLALFCRARFDGRARGVATAASGAATAALLLLPPSPERLWSRLHGTTADSIVHAEDGSGLSVLKHERSDEGDGTVVFVHGLGQSRLPYGGYHAVLGGLPVLLHPRPGRVAIVGLGSGTTLYAAAARRETWRLDCIEIVASQMQALRELAGHGRYPALTHLLEDVRVRYAFTDARAFLLRSPDRYDVIETDALRPGSAYSGNLYSVEFFRLMRERLAPGGLAVTWAPTPRVRATFARAFTHVLEVGDTLLGSDRPVPFDPTLVRRRLDDPFVRGHYARGGIDPDALLEDVLGAPRSRWGPEDDRSALVDINTDLHPKDEYLAGRRLLPRLSRRQGRE